MRAVIALILAVCLLVAAGCGGSDDDSSSSKEAQPYVDALVDDLTHPDEDGDLDLSDEEANCFAPRLVDAVGIDEIKDSGTSPSEFVDAETLDALDIHVDSSAEDEFADAFTDCLDDDAFAASLGFDDMSEECAEFFSVDNWARVFGAVFVRTEEDGLQLFTEHLGEAPGPCAEQLLLRGMTDDGQVTEEQASCIAERLDDSDAQALWRANIGQGDSSAEDPEADAAIAEAAVACGVPTG